MNRSHLNNNFALTISGLSLAVLPPVLPSPAWAQGGYGNREYGGHMMDWWWGGGFLGGLPMIILWIAVIVAAIFLVRWAWRSNQDRTAGTPDQDPLEILEVRYAKGELTREQFEAMRKDLGG
jgi:putative membrane protein